MKNNRILENNITLITDQNLGLNAVKISLFFKTGTYYETKQNYGITHLVEHLFFRKLEYLTQKELYVQTESIGAFLKGKTYRNFVCFEITVVPEYYKKAIQLISMILQPFKWNEQELSAEKKVVLKQIYNKRETFSEYQERLYFNNIKYSAPIMGNEQVIQSVDVDMVNNWKEKFFTCDNACVVITGAFQLTDYKYTVSLLEGISNKGTFINNKIIYPKHLFKRSCADDRIIPTNESLSDVWITFDVNLNEIFFTQAQMISSMLCRGDGSRLIYLLKDQYALTDDIESYVSLYQGFACITFQFTIENRDLEEGLQLFFNEIRNFKREIKQEDYLTTIPFFTKNLLKEKDDQENLNFDYGWFDFILGQVYDIPQLITYNSSQTIVDLECAVKKVLAANNMAINICNNSRIKTKSQIAQAVRQFRTEI